MSFVLLGNKTVSLLGRSLRVKVYLPTKKKKKQKNTAKKLFAWSWLVQQISTCSRSSRKFKWLFPWGINDWRRFPRYMLPAFFNSCGDLLVVPKTASSEADHKMRKPRLNCCTVNITGHQRKGRRAKRFAETRPGYSAGVEGNGA